MPCCWRLYRGAAWATAGNPRVRHYTRHFFLVFFRGQISKIRARIRVRLGHFRVRLGQFGVVWDILGLTWLIFVVYVPQTFCLRPHFVCLRPQMFCLQFCLHAICFVYNFVYSPDFLSTGHFFVYALFRVRLGHFRVRLCPPRPHKPRCKTMRNPISGKSDNFNLKQLSKILNRRQQNAHVDNIVDNLNFT